MAIFNKYLLHIKKKKTYILYRFIPHPLALKHSHKVKIEKNAIISRNLKTAIKGLPFSVVDELLWRSSVLSLGGNPLSVLCESEVVTIELDKALSVVGSYWPLFRCVGRIGELSDCGELVLSGLLASTFVASTEHTKRWSVFLHGELYHWPVDPSR